MTTPAGATPLRAALAASRLRAMLTRSGAGIPTWVTPLVILAALAVFVQSTGSGFLTVDLVAIKLHSALVLILVATGQTLVMLRGGIDLSVGGSLSLATAIAATRSDGSFASLLPWLGVILFAGIAVGVLNGVLVSTLEIQPFVVTLGTWSIAEGIALMILPAESATVPLAWFTVGNTFYGTIPASLLLLGALILWWVWFRGTRTAQRIVAAGSSERGAFLNRVSILRSNLVVYGMSGFFAALAGLVYSSQTGAGSPTVGGQYILPAIAAVVVGGTALTGGRGGLLGTIFGALILQLIADAVFILHLRSYWQPLVSGVILVLAVAAGQSGEIARLLRRRRVRRGQSSAVVSTVGLRAEGSTEPAEEVRP